MSNLNLYPAHRFPTPLTSHCKLCSAVYLGYVIPCGSLSQRQSTVFHLNITHLDESIASSIISDRQP